VKIEFSLHLSIDLNFRHTSKKIEEGSLKKILEKKKFSPKSMSNLGRFTVHFCSFDEVYSRPTNPALLTTIGKSSTCPTEKRKAGGQAGNICRVGVGVGGGGDRRGGVGWSQI
jgi:hypothetical protein